jgi:hypothetical protein
MADIVKCPVRPHRQTPAQPRRLFEYVRERNLRRASPRFASVVATTCNTLTVADSCRQVLIQAIDIYRFFCVLCSVCPCADRKSSNFPSAASRGSGRSAGLWPATSSRCGSRRRTSSPRRIIDAVADVRAAAEAAARQKTLGELVGPYLELREKGDEFWSKMRPNSLVDVTRYLTKSCQPLHGEPVETITRKMSRAARMRSFLRAAPSRPIVRSRRSAASMRGRSTRSITRAPTRRQTSSR